MKRERRTLIIKTFRCGTQRFSAFFLLRGVKGLEHFALLKGGYTDVIDYVKKNKLWEEVNEVLNLSGEEPIETSGFIKDYMRFIDRVVYVTHKLICREPRTNNLGD